MAEGRKPLDWSKAGTVESMCRWIQKSGDCVLVLAIRAEDAVLVLADGVKVADAEGVIYMGLADALERMGRKAEAERVKQSLRKIRSGVNE